MTPFLIGIIENQKPSFSIWTSGPAYNDGLSTRFPPHVKIYTGTNSEWLKAEFTSDSTWTLDNSTPLRFLARLSKGLDRQFSGWAVFCCFFIQHLVSRFYSQVNTLFKSSQKKRKEQQQKTSHLSQHQNKSRPSNLVRPWKNLSKPPGWFRAIQ